ncbi:dipeptide/oligopeptide/nickel ABC transporter permease/ATP-binding protein [Streptomyces sp. DH41]|uniref:dipeptide/oligopeptide/nickel ABC transporter permease/ATP-binding protein n=1 Tax=Streptomyces sp. DH41 TaxID=3040125 RepID=UPI002441EA6D|nr:dipeptide/oligopeptide/nickel ABC transporter permease/ATP-binding protein [Streptomyces sp. DH41]MDG9724374.1 dipeptide/oligopeptide/nickel ABC transporter permease/ATP-binding protein [Streptomyces sp. DH41]
MSTELPTAPPAQARRGTLRKLLRDPQAVASAGVMLVIVALGLFAPLLTERGPNEASLHHIDAAPGTPGYLLGGDHSGRDIWALLLGSINTSVVSALIGASVALVIGVTAGLIGGYYDRLKGITEWVFSLVMTFPGLLLLIVLMPMTKGDFRVTMLIFGVLLSPGVYRLVRNLVLGVKKELFVDAARVSGLSDSRILRRHILFAVRGPVIIITAFLCGSSIGIQAGLAFLGVGPATVPSFGSMVSEAFHNLYVEPLQILWPSLALGAMTICLVLFGNALRDTLEGATPASAKTLSTAAPVPRQSVEATTGNGTELLVIEDLTIAYPTPSGELKEVVSGMDLRLNPGETLGLVGESGSGKTQTAFAVLGVLPRDAVVVRGSIRLDGRELLDAGEGAMHRLRGKAIGYVPQEPMSNLDPSFTIGAQLDEGLRATSSVSREEARERTLALLKRVGIPDPQRTYDSYPHQISGGMAQRVLIAGAVAARPKLLIADEPTTALDVTIQAEILDLLRDLQQELGMAVLLVTHNFGVVADSCRRIAVMKQGEVVETGTAMEIFHAAEHPYTTKLLDAVLDGGAVRSDPPASETRVTPRRKDDGVPA